MKQTRLPVKLLTKIMASLTLASTILYAGVVAAEDAILPEPQLVKDLWTLETFFEADPEAIKIRYPALLAAADGLPVEHNHIRMCARDKTTSIRDAIGIGETACHHLHALLEGQVTALPNPVAEQM